ncbi:MAG: hypothetical protein KBS95_04175 [Alistipes sp.]|nr:hypothetical protein [Candidatus Alistipes equi]
MKNFKYILGLVALTLGFLLVSCSDDIKYDPAVKPEGAQVYFSNEAPTTFDASANTDKLVIDVLRVDTQEALTLNVIGATVNEEDASLFTFPTTVKFAAGADKASYTISFNRSQMVDGQSYPITVNILDLEGNITTPYGSSALSITVNAALEWIDQYMLVDPSKFLDDNLTEADYQLDENGNKIVQTVTYTYVQMWSGDDENLTFKRAKGTNRFRVSNWGGGTDFEFIVDKNQTVTVNGKQCYVVIVPDQFTGYTHSSYGDVYVVDSANYTGEGYNAWPSYFDAENGRFVPNVTFYVSAGYFGMGEEYCTLDIIKYDLDINVQYNGMFVEADNVTASALLEFTYGADVQSLDYVIAEGTLTDEELAAKLQAILDGTIEVSTLEPNETLSEIVKAKLEAGFYTIVALPKKDDAYQPDYAISYNFYFPGLNSSVPDCDVNAKLYYVSDKLPSYSSQFPDYSSLAFVISSESKDVKTVTTLMADKETFDYYLTSKGYTLEELVAEYGTAFTANELAEITTGGTYLDVYTGLDASTEYELAVVATNSYGKAVTVFDVKATKEAPAYSGELVIGNYTITDTVSLTGGTSEQTFTVLSKDGTDSNISIKNLANDDDFEWYATYDKSQNTVTLDGMAYGYESYGSIFLYTLYTLSGYSAGYLAGNSGTEPIVFGVDPSTHQISNLQTDYALFAADATSILGYFQYFGAGVATIVKSQDTNAAKTSLSVPFSSVNKLSKKNAKAAVVKTIGKNYLKVKLPKAGTLSKQSKTYEKILKSNLVLNSK